MKTPDPQAVRIAYIRICRDSGFTIEFERAAALTGQLFGITALEVWPCFPYLKDMMDIASGTHPALTLPEDKI